MCACVEPVGTAIGVVCVEYGRPKWPITMLNHTRCTEECFVFYFWHPMLVRPVMKRLFSLGKPRKSGLASLARLMIVKNSMIFGIRTHEHNHPKVAYSTLSLRIWALGCYEAHFHAPQALWYAIYGQHIHINRTELCLDGRNYSKRASNRNELNEKHSFTTYSIAGMSA